MLVLWIWPNKCGDCCVEISESCLLWWCFALSSNNSLDELNSRSRTMDSVQLLFFKCLSSDAIITLRLSGS